MVIAFVDARYCSKCGFNLLHLISCVSSAVPPMFAGGSRPLPPLTVKGFFIAASPKDTPRA
jgi:hypothetical protein